MAATSIKELIQPYPFGTANILRLSWHSELLNTANQVVKALKWRGIIMIEFIRDQKDNKLKVIEVNVRPWLFIGFYTRFGLNFIDKLYQDWTEGLEPYDGNTIVPSEATLKLSPIHIDLIGIANHFNEEEKVKYFIDDDDVLLHWLKSFSQNIISTYALGKDNQPWIKSCDNLCNSTRLSKDYLLKNVTDSLYVEDSNVSYTALTSSRFSEKGSRVALHDKSR